MAACAHRKQRRARTAREKRGRPYIEHPIEVAAILEAAFVKTDPVLLCAALLHDVMEDTDVKAEMIETSFGAEVRDIVEDVTNPGGMGENEKLAWQCEAMFRWTDPRSKWLKIADKLANMRDWRRARPVRWKPIDIARMEANAMWLIAAAGTLPAGLEREVERTLPGTTQRAGSLHRHLVETIEFSHETFGPGRRDAQLSDHIAHERAEVESATNQWESATEYLDIAALSIDGLWRTGCGEHHGDPVAAAHWTKRAIDIDTDAAFEDWIARANERQGALEENERRTRIDATTQSITEMRDDAQRVQSYENIAELAVTGSLNVLGTDAGEPSTVARIMRAKLARNRCRTWPDWREHPTDRALEHRRGAT